MVVGMEVLDLSGAARGFPVAVVVTIVVLGLGGTIFCCLYKGGDYLVGGVVICLLTGFTLIGIGTGSILIERGVKEDTVSRYLSDHGVYNLEDETDVLALVSRSGEFEGSVGAFDHVLIRSVKISDNKYMLWGQVLGQPVKWVPLSDLGAMRSVEEFTNYYSQW